MGSAGGWASIPSDLLTEILANPRYLGSDPTVALTLSHVCRDWREAILGDRWALEKLKYRRLTRRVPDEAVPPLPAIFTASLAHGNEYAHVARAKFLVSLGQQHRAETHWRQAAKRNHPLGLFHVGLNKYQEWGDAEDAYIHLKRACKQLMCGEGCEGCEGCKGCEGCESQCESASDDDFLLTRLERTTILRQASLIVGIIIADNDLEFEGFREKDYSGAIAWYVLMMRSSSLSLSSLLSLLSSSCGGCCSRAWLAIITIIAIIAIITIITQVQSRQGTRMQRRRQDHGVHVPKRPLLEVHSKPPTTRPPTQIHAADSNSRIRLGMFFSTDVLRRGRTPLGRLWSAAFAKTLRRRQVSSIDVSTSVYVLVFSRFRAHVSLIRTCLFRIFCVIRRGVDVWTFGRLAG